MRCPRLVPLSIRQETWDQRATVVRGYQGAIAAISAPLRAPIPPFPVTVRKLQLWLVDWVSRAPSHHRTRLRDGRAGRPLAQRSSAPLHSPGLPRLWVGRAARVTGTATSFFFSIITIPFINDIVIIFFIVSFLFFVYLLPACSSAAGGRRSKPSEAPRSSAATVRTLLHRRLAREQRHLGQNAGQV